MSERKVKTFQEKMAELNRLVEFFDSADFDLEEALAKYKEAEKLSEDIRKSLEELKNEITVLKERFDG
jgi:exodeoxyribonuclease VII small subunit